MARHLVRSRAGSPPPRDHAADRPRRKASTSALTGHVDYVELAERVGQGVSVLDMAHTPPKTRWKQRR